MRHNDIQIARRFTRIQIFPARDIPMGGNFLFEAARIEWRKSNKADPAGSIDAGMTGIAPAGARADYFRPADPGKGPWRRTACKILRWAAVKASFSICGGVFQAPPVLRGNFLKETTNASSEMR
jgi:hypothetical protein